MRLALSARQRDMNRSSLSCVSGSASSAPCPGWAALVQVLCRAAPWRIDQVSSRIVVDGVESMCPGALDPQDAGVRVIELAIAWTLRGIAYHPAPSQPDLVPHLCGASPSDVLTLKSGSVPVV
jgi:hypothetical protein